MKTAIACEGGSGVRSCELKATRLWSGNFPGGNQWESRNHLCVQSSPLQRNYPVQTPTFLGAEPPWPSPRSTCCKASQFAAHFVLDIKKKVERAGAAENNTHWHIHEFQWKTKGAAGKETSIQVTLPLNFRGNRTFLGLMFKGKNNSHCITFTQRAQNHYNSTFLCHHQLAPWKCFHWQFIHHISNYITEMQLWPVPLSVLCQIQFELWEQ